MLRVCLIALSIVGASQGLAQNIGATDNELYAAYCVGVLHLAQTNNSQPLQSDPGVPADVQQRIQRMRVENADKLVSEVSRFSSYLMASGALSRSGAALGLSGATNQGRSDLEHCSKTEQQCSASIWGGPGSPYVPLRPHGDDRLTRMLACTDQDQSCSRSVRCFGPDNLPF
jgi:hypothetical protein